MEKSSLWIRHFEQNLWDVPAFFAGLPKDSAPHLSPRQKQALVPSIQQFQLGEGSEGRGLRQAAQGLADRLQDPDLATCYRLFIQEEQRHSLALGLFLAQQGQRCLSGHWVDGCFRWMRRLAGFEVYARVLVTAEFIAVPYYEALRDATASRTLKAICERILQDESHHLRFQGWAVYQASAGRGRRGQYLVRRLHQLFTLAVCLIVWKEHRRVFSAASWSLYRFLETAWRSGLYFHQVAEGLLPGQPQSALEFQETASLASLRLRD